MRSLSHHAVRAGVARAAIVVSLAIASLPSSASAQSTELWVSPTGSDLTGDGSVGNPYRTLSHAGSLVVSGGTLRLTGGTFGADDVVTLSSKDVSVVGSGTDVTFIEPHASTLRSLLVGPAPGALEDHVAVVVVTGSVHVQLRDLTLDCSNRVPASGHCNGLYVAGGASVLLDRVSVVRVRAVPSDGLDGAVAVAVHGYDPVHESSVTMRQCRVTDFAATGVHVHDHAHLHMSQCVVSGDLQVSGTLVVQTGVLVVGGATAVVVTTSVRDMYGNPAVGHSGGVRCIDAGAGCVIDDNCVARCDVGVSVVQSSLQSPVPAVVSNNRVTECRVCCSVTADGTTVRDNVLHRSTDFDAFDDTDASLPGGSSNVWSSNSYSSHSGGGVPFPIPGSVSLVDSSADNDCDDVVEDATYAVGGVPSSLAVGDLDGDGRLDFVTCNEGATLSSPPTLSVALSSGLPTGHVVSSFSFGTSVSVPTDLAVGDFDGAPGLDVCVVTDGDHSLRVFSNSGGGALSLLHTVDLSLLALSPSQVLRCDLDASGGDDMCVAMRGGLGQPGAVVLLTNLGGGASWSSSLLAVPLTGQCKSVAVADLDSLGGPDFVVTDGSGSSGAVHVVLDDGSGVLSSPPGSPFAVDPDPTFVTVGDLNRDGLPDIACCCTNAAAPLVSGTLVVHGDLSLSSGASSVTRLSVGTAPVCVAHADLGDNSDPDTLRTELCVADFASGRLSTMHVSDGAVVSNRVCTSVSAPRRLALGDLDGDGRDELLVADAATVSVVVVDDFATQARSDAYGSGCPGTSSYVPHIRSSGALSSRPTQPNLAFALDVTNARPLSVAVLLGSSHASSSLASCDLHLATIDLSVVAFTNSVGEARVQAAVSSSPSLTGLELYFQFLVVDPDGEFFQLASLSDALRVRVGS